MSKINFKLFSYRENDRRNFEVPRKNIKTVIAHIQKKLIIKMILNNIYFN